MSEVLRVAVIGAGKIAADHLQCLKAIKSVEIIGIANRSGKGLEKLAKDYSIKATYTNWQKMLDECRPDAVWVISGINSLAEITHEVLKQGYHCFVEKPVALNSDTISKLAKLADDKNKQCMVGFNRRFYYPILKSWLISQSAGALRSIHIEVNEDIEEVIKKNKHPKNVIDNWMIANSIHLIDLFAYFCDDIVVKNTLWTQSEVFEKSSFSSILDINHGQVIGGLVGNWSSPRGSSIKLRLDDMSIDFNGIEHANVMLKCRNKSKINKDYKDQQFKIGFMRQTEFFVNCILNDQPIMKPAANLWDCYKTVKLIEDVCEGKQG